MKIGDLVREPDSTDLAIVVLVDPSTSNVKIRWLSPPYFTESYNYHCLEIVSEV